MLLPEEVDYVIYHGGCCDGFASALAPYIYFKNSGKTITYYPASFNKPPPNISGKNVLICDFSYKKNDILKMIVSANKLLIIDHHIGAKQELVDISDDNKIFDMDHSGAYLTWRYFFPSEEVPMLIRHVEDRDIWKFVVPNTKEVSAYMFCCVPFEFEEYAKLLDPKQLEAIIPVGAGMLKQSEYYVKSASATVKFIELDNKYYLVAHCNYPILKSEIGHELLTKYANCNFSCVYNVDCSDSWVSLRSDETRTDVCMIAKRFGGGGHRNASGITVYNSTELPTRLLDNNLTYNSLKNLHILNDFCVQLCCSNNMRQVSKYLLQERVVENVVSDGSTTSRPVQEACSILRNKTSDKTVYYNFNVSMVWCQNDLHGRYVVCHWTDKITNASVVLQMMNLSVDSVNDLHVFNDERILTFIHNT